MKELSIEEKAKAYDNVREKIALRFGSNVAEEIFSEYEESKDEKIRQFLIHEVTETSDEIMSYRNMNKEDVIAWIEKQVPVDEDEIVKGVRRGVAISLMNHIDANSKGMCLSNMECEDIENAIVNEDWNKVYGYMKKKLEKQGEHANFLSKIQVGDKVTRNQDGVLVNLSQLKRVAKPADKVEPKPAWSEEDEMILSDIIKDLVHPWNEYIPDRIEDEIKWLKNRLKSLRPQNTWKPSDEQMEALLWCVAHLGGADHRVLGELYEHLKKIKG